MVSPRSFCVRRRVRTPDPRLFSDGRRRSLSPPLDEEPPSLESVDQIVLMFSLEEPRADPSKVKYLLREVQAVGLPFLLVFNKTDLVKQRIFSKWESILDEWGVGGCFISLQRQLGLSNLHMLLKGKASLVIGPKGVGKSSLIKHLTKGEDNSQKCKIHNVVKKAEKWLTERHHPGKLIEGDIVSCQNPALQSYFVEIYQKIDQSDHMTELLPKASLVKMRLERDRPELANLASWLYKIEKEEQESYFLGCSNLEQKWWNEHVGKLKESSAPCQPLTHVKPPTEISTVIDNLFALLYEDWNEHQNLLEDMRGFVTDNPTVCSNIALESAAIEVIVTLMHVGPDALKISGATLLQVFADRNYESIVKIGQVGGLGALVQLVASGDLNAQKTSITTISILVKAEENWSKFLHTRAPEVIVSTLASSTSGDDLLEPCCKVISQLHCFKLAWNRFFSLAFERLQNVPTHLYSAVMATLIRTKHESDLYIEYLEGHPGISEEVF